MPRKQPFPPEADTQPDIQRPSGPAPKSKRARADAPTVPPPKAKRGKGAEAPPAKTTSKANMPRTSVSKGSLAKASEPRNSGIRSRRPPSTKRDPSGAAVDEVTADLSRDPRRERDDDD